MQIPIELPDTARIWVFQAERVLAPEEESMLEAESKAFAEQWAAHGTNLRAEAAVLFRHFLIFAVDESVHGVSGCSIDSSMRFVTGMEKKLGISLTNRLRVAVWENEGVTTYSMDEFTNFCETGRFRPDTLVFNNLVASLGQMKNEWRVPIAKSWHKKLLPVGLIS